MILFSKCVFPKKINNQFGRLPFFQRKSVNFPWTGNKNTHFTDENQRNKNRKGQPSLTIINFSSRIMNHSTTTTTGSDRFVLPPSVVICSLSPVVDMSVHGDHDGRCSEATSWTVGCACTGGTNSSRCKWPWQQPFITVVMLGP